VNDYADTVLKRAMGAMTTPDFNKLFKIITGKYGKEFGEKAIADAQVSWYSFLIWDKKQPEYWPQLLAARIQDGRLSHFETAPERFTHYINNVAYDEFFKHCDEQDHLKEVTKWMKAILQYNLSDGTVIDTYAALLYKTGDVQEAIQWENKALELAKKFKAAFYVKLFSNTVDKMKQGAKFWLDKEYEGL
jgi:tetratricopeptide (TPR) repeat protein